jgi:hypothetical protein
MKTAQVVSGFLLGSSLLVTPQIVSAQYAFSDGGVHVVNDDSLRNALIDVSNGSTLRLETGALIGGESHELGFITVHDTSSVVVAGGQVGVGSGGGGGILLEDQSQLVVEDGVFGGDSASSGQVSVNGQASVKILGGHFGGAGDQSGMIGLYDDTLGEIHGGQFGGGGAYSGLVIGLVNSQCQISLCQSDLPFGPVAETMGVVTGVTKTGEALNVPFMHVDNGVVAVVEDCNDDPPVVDTDGDGVPDATDLCPESDLRPTVWILNIDTGIPNLINGNRVNADGCSLNDLVDAIVDDASQNSKNHGEFLRAVTMGLRQLQKEGLLPTRLFGSCVNCAARCHWEDGRSHRRHGDRNRGFESDHRR